jgi:hypothetical protein
MTPTNLNEFGSRYAAAWCSQDAASVARFFELDGSLRINGGAASEGREAISKVAQSFMTAFPDLVVSMDDLETDGDQSVFHWTLVGNNTGPGGTGAYVRICGYELWTLGPNGLIQYSQGHFDAADYDRQIGAVHG